MITRRSLLLSLPALGAFPALAQGYPERPIKFVVPVAPASATDLTARQMSAALTRLWNGAPVVVDSAPYAGRFGKHGIGHFRWSCLDRIASPAG